MANFIDWLNSLVSTQSGSTFYTNDSERDGNVNDLLLRFEQPTGVNVQGPTTLTNLDPASALNDLANGKLSWGAIVWILIIGGLCYWAFKHK